MLITLHTGTSGREVATVDIPAYDPPAKIICHKGRFFVWKPFFSQYREESVFFVPEAPLTEDFDPRRPVAPKAIDGVDIASLIESDESYEASVALFSSKCLLLHAEPAD